MDTPPVPVSAEALLASIDALAAELHAGGRAAAGLDSRFDRDLGFDSLTRVELLARVEQRFGVRLPDDTLNIAETPRQLFEALQRCGAASPAAPPAPPPVAVSTPTDVQPPAAARTLNEVLQWHTQRQPDRIHVLFQHDDEHEEPLSYRTLAQTAAHIGTVLRARGVRPGECVALMLPSGLDFFRCFLGILEAGAVPVPLYPPSRPALLEDHLRRQAGILRNCEAALLIAFDAVRPLARLLRGLTPTLRDVLTPEELQQAPAPAGMVPAPPAPGDLALIQYTSGSTGEPKGVALTHANLLANIRAWGEAVQLKADDVCVSWLPLYHDMGLIGAWLGALYHGLPLVMMSPLDFLARPERWLWTLHRHRGTVTAAPNFAFDLCVRRLAGQELAGLDLSCWRLAANGAEPVNPDTLERFAAAFAPYGFRREALTPVYGLAECTVGLGVPPPGRGPRIDRIRRTPFAEAGRAEPAGPQDADTLRFVACGPPLSGHEVRVVDARERPLEERRVGLLHFRGPSATDGYYRNPAASAALFHDGWLDSGDYAYLADGEIFICGRAKELIIRGGRNLYPYELEQAAGELPGVRKGCVAAFGIGDPGASDGERLIVVAETRETDPTARAALTLHIAELASELMELPPDEVVLAPPHTIPKTSSGKVRRAELRTRYLAGTLAQAQRAPWLQVLRLAAAALPGRLRAAGAAVADRLRGWWGWAMLGLHLPPALAALALLPRLGQRWAVCRLLARSCLRLSGYHLRVAGLQHLPPGPCVLLANHASYLDGMILAAALPRPVRFVAKGELTGHRLLTAFLTRLGARFVERLDARRSVADAQALADSAREAPPLMFFAEGTFERAPGLRLFRLGAFQSAALAGVPVVPVALAGTRALMPDGDWRPHAARLAVTVCPPLTPQGSSWHDLLALRDAARAAIAEHCGEAMAGG
ncbi:AMP-binding protein [Pseudothauera rhizosphaerae]|uniref:Acyl-phosphate glycerol 3-phosphate acyltransferase n=1 Tax=Pseudothauera rhizosphaerae TaxID=2565932 RepID=A0A4S4AY67_9RHOO|nr:AMP-binding protein [Pseudothauera rhizosphaerae]THF64278.1 acyl-phosphate glycerol 3-phosphate acyltransferase [Pseudothauera rhizosphaerae]